MALTTVNTDGITDGTIKDIDVKTGAQIAGSKITPDFGSQAISGGKISLYDNGSSSPTVLIATDDASPFALQIRNDTVSNATQSGLKFWQGSNTAGNIQINGATAYLPLQISQKKDDTNDTKTALYIDASQNVGIGTATPTDKLDLYSSTDNSRLLRLSHPVSPTGAGGFLGFSSDGTTDNFVITLGCQYSGNYYNVLNIKRSNQKVGIGTINPDKDLTISSASPSIKLIDSDVTSTTCFATIDSSSHAGLIFDCDPDNVRSGSDIRFNVDNVERLRINNDGRVYFGDYADVATQAYIESSGDSPWALTISASNSTSTDRGIVFRLRPGHKAAEFDTDGHLKFPNGHGINFDGQTNSGATGATASAEVLDHYEEGTWTPTFAGSSTAGTATVTAAHCQYTRIGNLVNVTFDISWDNFTGTGHLQIGGLPWTPKANCNVTGPVMTQNLNTPTMTNEVTSVVAHTWGSVSYFRLYVSQDNGGVTAVQCDDNAVVTGNLTYMTA